MEKLQEKDSIKKYNRYIWIIVFGICYFFLIGDFGPIITRDSGVFISDQYIAPHGYAVYHLFLKVCRLMSGERYYLTVAVILQGIFGVFSCLLASEWFGKIIEADTKTYVLIYILSCSTYGFSLMEAVSSHYIMTESVSFPLFYVYFLLLLKYRANKGIYRCLYGVYSLILAIILMFTRSQLAIVPLATILLFIWDYLWSKIKKHGYQLVSTVLIICLLLFIGRGVAVWLINDGNLPSQFMDALGGRTLLLADEDDRVLFEGETQQVYDYVYAKVKEGGHLEENLRTNTWRGYDIGVHTNENVKLFGAAIKDYYYSTYGDSVFEDQDKYEGQFKNRFIIIATLLNEHWLEYLKMTGDLIIQSLVAASFIQPDAYHELFYILCLFMYLAYISSYIYARKCGVDKDIFDVSHVTIYIMLMNIIATNIFFYGQQRYVVYTFGFFYISWFLILIGIYRKKRDGHKA